MARVSAVSPPLAATYAGTFGRAIIAMIELIMTILPEPRAAISRAASRARTKQAVRLTSMTRCQSSSESSSSEPRCTIPALPTSTSSPPKRSLISSNAALTASWSETSNGAIAASYPAPPSSSARAFSVCGSRPLSTTRAPAAAIARAVSQPRPRDAPVTRTILSSRENGLLIVASPPWSALPTPRRRHQPRRNRCRDQPFVT